MSGTITFDELMNAPDSDLKTLVDAYFDGTRYMHDFSSREVMVPVLKMLLSPSPQEIAVRDTYYKMCLLLRSALVMNNLEHFQSVASLTRSIFELWLDLKILAKDQTGEDVRKYNEFPEIERYRAAEQLVDFADANPQVLKADTSAQRAFLANLKRKQRVDAAVGTKAPGKRRYPEHWARKSVRARAGSLGQEAMMYVEVYPLLSWYVHAGAPGTAGMSKGDFESMFGFCHSVIQRIFVDATATCAKTTKISSLDYFSDWMTSIKLKTGEFIVTEQIKLLDAKRKQATP
jgi:Family of unknown function (DUF5677)